GEPLSKTFLRLDKSGRDVWLEASYMPILNADKQVTSILKVATDVSAAIHKERENQSMINAIARSMAMIEFSPDGNIIKANDNFLKTMHYQLNEVVGQHHSMFCKADEKDSASYKAFWASLNRGEYHSHRLKRVNKFGHTVFLEA